jgi:glycosyltransferase involved in cell wall biosynthesis
MRVLCVTEFPIRDGHRWLWSHLPPNDDEVDFCFPARIPADRFSKWGKLLSYYPAYWRFASQALAQTRRASYDVVLAFEGKNGLPLGFLRRLAGGHQPKLVIQFFSVKGVIMHFLPLARFAMQGVDHIIVPCRREIGYYNRLLGWPPQKVTYCPIGSYDQYVQAAPSADSGGDGYVFAGGRSDRDYQTFVQAISGTDCRVIINTRRFAVAGTRLPPNVQVNDLMPFSELRSVLAHARFVVVPLRNVAHAAGLSQIVLAMSAGKAVIASRAGGAEDYVEPGLNGLLVEPNDVTELRRAILHLLHNPDEAERMGKAGRARYERCHTFEEMSAQVRQVLLNVCSQA